MTHSVVKHLYAHLESLNLQPEYLPLKQMPLSGCEFLLAPGIHSVIFVISSENTIQMQIVTEIDVPFHEELHILASMLSPCATPLSFDSNENQVALRLNMTATSEDMANVLNESIILSRHMAGIFFTATLALCEGKKNTMEAFDYAIELFSHERFVS